MAKQKTYSERLLEKSQAYKEQTIKNQKDLLKVGKTMIEEFIRLRNAVERLDSRVKLLLFKHKGERK